MPASTTYEPADVVITVSNQNHVYFRRPHRLADRINALGDPFMARVRSCVVIDTSTGLTSSWRDDVMTLDAAIEAADAERGVALAAQCEHYYTDPSGGFGWPSCVKCGSPAPTEGPDGPRQRLACCGVKPGEMHRLGCSSLDAAQRRGQQ